MLSQAKNRTRVLFLTSIVLLSLVAAAMLSSSFSMFDEIGFARPGSNVEAVRPSSPAYAHYWDDNPVAYIPEASVNRSIGGYAHNWDDNPVAYIPEASVIRSSGGYAHDWDDNPFAYIPEASVITRP